MTNNEGDDKKKEIFERLKQLLVDLLKGFREGEKEPPVIDWNTDVVDDLGVDSVETLDLMNAIEEEFDVNPNLSEANTKRKVGQIVDYIIELSGREV